MPVAVHIGHFPDSGTQAHYRIQYHLGIAGIRVAVSVQITVQLCRGNKGNAIRPVAHLGRQRRGLGIQVSNAVLGELILGEEICRQGIAPVLLGQVVQGKGYAVSAGSLGIVPQLGLDLPIGGGSRGGIVHADIDIRGYHRANVGQTRALPQDRPIVPAAGLLPKRNGSGHEQTQR